MGNQRKDLMYSLKGDLLTKKARSQSEIPSSIVVSGSENINSRDPYMPELPVMPQVPFTNQEPCFVSDHASIRKLLITLGGKFASDDNVNQSNNMVSQIPIDSNLIDLQASSQNDQNFTACSIPLMLPNSQHNILPMQEGQSGTFPSVIEEMYYSNNPQKVDGLEFLYGDMCEVNTSGSSSVITCGDSMDWGEMSSLVSNTTMTNFMNSSNYQKILH